MKDDFRSRQTARVGNTPLTRSELLAEIEAP